MPSIIWFSRAPPLQLQGMHNFNLKLGIHSTRNINGSSSHETALWAQHEHNRFRYFYWLRLTLHGYIVHYSIPDKFRRILWNHWCIGERGQDRIQAYSLGRELPSHRLGEGHNCPFGCRVRRNSRYSAFAANARNIHDGAICHVARQHGLDWLPGNEERALQLNVSPYKHGHWQWVSFQMPLSPQNTTRLHPDSIEFWITVFSLENSIESGWSQGK